MHEGHACALLGQLLLSTESVTQGDLERALAEQEHSGEPLGEILIDMRVVSQEQVERALRLQARLRGRPGPSRGFVLVVDDDPEVGAVLGEILEGAGYRVGVAQDASEAAIAVLAPDGDHPRLVVLDMALPGTSGLEFLAIMRNSAPSQTTPVVVLTGRPDTEAEIRERGLAISEFLAKPISARKLLESVEAALSQSRASAAR